MWTGGVWPRRGRAVRAPPGLRRIWEADDKPLGGRWRATTAADFHGSHCRSSVGACVITGEKQQEKIYAYNRRPCRLHPPRGATTTAALACGRAVAASPLSRHRETSSCGCAGAEACITGWRRGQRKWMVYVHTVSKRVCDGPGIME
jgi:hypothetical protein